MSAERDENQHDEMGHDVGWPGRATQDEGGQAGTRRDGGRQGGARRADHDETPHLDGALMAAVTGEPPSEAALADGVFAEEYRSATNDVAVLREQLRLIGGTLAEPPFRPASKSSAPTMVQASTMVQLPARRRRTAPLVLTLRGLMAAVGAVVAFGMGWLVVHSDGTGALDDRGASSAADSSTGRPQGGEGSKISHAAYLACARLVAEGTVAEVETVRGTAQIRVTLDVTRYYEPAEGRSRITFPLARGTVPTPRAGDRALIGIPQGQDEPDLWTTGEKELARGRAWITAALPASRTYPCR